MKKATRTLIALFGASVLSFSFAGSAMAKNSVSLGKGIKCSWVLVSSVGSTNTYKQICRKGV